MRLAPLTHRLFAKRLCLLAQEATRAAARALDADGPGLDADDVVAREDALPVLAALQARLCLIESDVVS